MPIATHVTSLELSRRLKELKVPQNSFAFWINVDSEFPEVHYKGLCTGGISAYLASEIGEFIGNSLENGEYEDLPEELQTTSIQDVWKPDYLAKLLIWLLENHLISVEELGN